MAKQILNCQCDLNQHLPVLKLSGEDGVHWHCDHERSCREYHATAAEARWCEFKTILARQQVSRISPA